MALTAWETYAEDRLVESMEKKLATVAGSYVGDFVSKKLCQDLKQFHNPNSEKTTRIYVRKRLPATLPKWRDATDADVNLVVDFVLRESLSLSTVSIEKEPVAWEEFWRNAADTHSKTAHLSGGKMGFVKAATIIKYALFGQSSALTIAQTVKALPLLQKQSRRGPRIIRESLIFDDEIQGR